MKSLLILGAGGYGHLVKELAGLVGYDKIGFLDDNYPKAIGKLNEVDDFQDSFDDAIVAIGDANLRCKYVSKIKNLATLVHPKATISPSAEIGKGVVIEAQCVINTGSIVKDGAFVCAGAVVNHNAVVGLCCQIDCNAVVGSFSEVPQCTKVESCQVWKNDEE